MLKIEGLTRPGLKPVTLELPEGSCTTIEGPSGSGKTLLLRAIADLDPSQGRVSLNGRSREDMPAPHWRRKVCYLPAEPGWWAETLPPHFKDWEKAKECCARLGLKPDLAERPLRLLSTGERLRLALARALEGNPSVLLLDEPTGPLDREASRAVEDILLERQKAGAILIWVTHDPNQAERIGAPRFRMCEGRLEELKR